MNQSTKRTYRAALPAIAAMMAVSDIAAAAIEEIVVSARRRDESLQTVPVAVTAFSPVELQQRGVTDIKQLQQSTPSLYIQPATGTGNGAVINLRGQIQNDNLITLDPSVGVYIDDVYAARSYGLLFDLLDVDHLEVLKGPQGTLYGRNTTGGAIKVVTKKAQVGDSGITGFLRAGAGDYSAYKVSGAINVPMGDAFALRYAGSYNRRDGYNELVLVDPFANNAPIRTIDQNDQDAHYHRLNATWKATDALTLWGQFEYFHNESNGQFTVNRAGDLLGGSLATLLVARPSAYRLNDFRTGIGDPLCCAGGAPRDSIEVRAGSVTAQYDFSDRLSTKLIVGYRANDSESVFNTDGGAAVNALAALQFGTLLNQSNEQVSVEWQLSGKAFDDRLNWLAGFYYFNETGDDVTGGGGNIIAGRIQRRINDASAENTSTSGFAHGDYAITDRLTFSGGVRYTVDDKSMEGHNRLDAAPIALVNGQIPTTPAIPCINLGNAPGFNLATCTLAVNDSFSFVDFDAGFDYKFTDRIFGYVKASRGNRSGGQQIRYSNNPASILPFEPETATNFEIGVKADFFDDRLRTNLAYYHTLYDQVQQSLIVTTPTGGSTTLVANIGSGDIDGFEFEGTVALGDHLTLRGSVGVISISLFNDNPAAATSAALGQVAGQVIGDQQQAKNPEFTASIGANYVRPFSWGEGSLRVDYGYRSSTNVRFEPLFNENNPYGKVDGIGLVNGRIGAKFGDGRYEAGLWVKNLFDERYFSSAINISPTLNVHPGQLGDPRTIGVEFGVNFN
ncbi:MAG: TonB-dependent receptor [Gammaproteobacteria bacterium]